MFNEEKLLEIEDILLFARNVNTLNHLVRYPTTPHIKDEVVSSHCYFVILLSYKLYHKYKNVIELDFTKLISQAILHDVAESDERVGDVSHPQKEKNEILKRSLEQLELDVVAELFSDVEKEYLQEYMLCKTHESILVTIADVISCLIYSEFEIQKGNSYMNRVKYESEERLIELLEKLKKCKRK